MGVMQVPRWMASFPSNDTKGEPSSAGLHMRAAEDAERPPLLEPSSLGYTWYAMYLTPTQLVSTLIFFCWHGEYITLASSPLTSPACHECIGNLQFGCDHRHSLEMTGCCHRKQSILGPSSGWATPNKAMPKAGQYLWQCREVAERI